MHNLIVYRISQTSFIRDLSGTGAKLYGGRWNAAGIPAVYTSGSIALALLEVLCYAPMHLLKNNYSIAEIHLTEVNIKTLTTNELPGDWKHDKTACQQLVQPIYLHYNCHVIKVPSAVIPHENNFVVNPHAKNLNMRIAKIWPLELDLRLQNQ